MGVTTEWEDILIANLILKIVEALSDQMSTDLTVTKKEIRKYIKKRPIYNQRRHFKIAMSGSL